MIRTILFILVTAVVLVASAEAKTPRLAAQTGPGYNIEVMKAGKKLTTLKAGSYTIKLEDKSRIHNFHLKGPGVNKSTTLRFRGEVLWRIKLKPGRYTYQCDKHAFQGMKGSFRVTK